MTDQLLSDLEVSRLVTLTGGPGVGKSRLAAQLAGQIARRGDGEVKVVDLGEVAELGLLEQLDDQPSLLVLDNCEHLIDQLAPLAERLLFSSADVRILATSRERLGIIGEIVHHLRPQEGIITDGQGSSSLTPGTGRHHSPEEAMAASEALIGEPERCLLRRLSVFTGDFSLEATRQVCAAAPIEASQILRLLGRLVDTSMVEVDTIAGRSRYSLTPVVGVYSKARLVDAGEEDRIRFQHAAWYVSVGEATPGIGVDRVGHDAWAAKLRAEEPNLRAALAWAVAQRRAPLAIRLARAQLVLWRLTGAYRQADDALSKVTSIAHHAPAALQASVHCDRGMVAALLGDHAAARKHLEQSLLLFDGSDAAGEAAARHALALLSVFQDGPAVARRNLQDNLERARGTASDHVLSSALSAMGSGRMLWGEAEPAAEAFEEAIATARRVGDQDLVAQGLVGAGWAALAAGEFDRAGLVLEEGRALSAEMGECYGEVVALGWLGELARLRGDVEVASGRFEACRARAAAMATPFPLTVSLIGLARLALDEGHGGAARAWLYEALQIATRSGLSPLVAGALEALAQVVLAEGGAQAAERFERAVEAARRCGDKATIARCLAGLGTTARRDGDLERAWTLHHQALVIRHEIGDRAGCVDSIEALAGLAINRAGPLVPGRLFGAAEGLREKLGYRRRRLDQEDYEADLAALREAMNGAALATAWAEGAAMTMDKAVSYASRGRGRQRQPQMGWEGLTDTEREVASLVAQGLKNAEIAERLLMARETVKTHVSRILVKLGAKSRWELAALLPNDSTST